MLRPRTCGESARDFDNRVKQPYSVHARSSGDYGALFYPCWLAIPSIDFDTNLSLILVSEMHGSQLFTNGQFPWSIEAECRPVRAITTHSYTTGE